MYFGNINICTQNKCDLDVLEMVFYVLLAENLARFVSHFQFHVLGSFKFFCLLVMYWVRFSIAEGYVEFIEFIFIF